MNKQIIISTIIAATLSGCAVSGRPGEGDNPALNADYKECEAVALQAHPIKAQDVVSVPTYTYGGVSYGLKPEVQEVDLNQNRRNRERESCLARKGWKFTPIAGWAKT